MSEYLADGETVAKVIRQDNRVLKKARVTHEQVGEALELVLKSFNWHKDQESWRADRAAKKSSYADEHMQRVNGTLSVAAVGYRGTESCPFDHCTGASIDYYVYGPPNGNKGDIGFPFGKQCTAAEKPTLVSEMMPTLIRKHHFFEGKVRYGIRPQWAIEILRIVEKDAPKIWVPKKQLVYQKGSSTGDLSKDFCGSFSLRGAADRTIKLAPGVTLYIKGEEAVVFATRNFKIQSGMSINGLPVQKPECDSIQIYKGQTFFTKREEIVG